MDWLVRRSRRLLDEGRIEEAMPHLEKVLALAREIAVRVGAHVLLADVLRDREEYARAAAHLRAAADLAPDDAGVLYRLGLAHAHQENNRAAADALRRASSLRPEDPEVLRALGVALAAVGDDVEAGALLGRAAEASPGDVRVLESLALHHLKMGRFAECGTVVEKALALAPDNRLVRRLAKEAHYLVELAAGGSPPDAEPARRGLRVALGGAAGEVERRFVESMSAGTFTEAQVMNARDLWRNYLEARVVRIRQPAEHAAAIELLIARMDFVDGCARDEVARRHGVEESAVARIYHDVVRTLDIAVFDQRYCTQRHPIETVGEHADRSGLPPEEVFQALVEDEFREYEALHAGSDSPPPRLEREEFEDASVEYGALLTREMMGLTLARRDRIRKRELERILLVT